MKMFGALPLLTFFKEQNNVGLSRNPQQWPLLNNNTILKILEDVMPGQHIAIGGRPSMGKSSVALNLVNEIVSDKKSGCVYFSLESSKESIMHRLINVASGISYSATGSGQFSETDYSRLVQATEKMTNANLYINDDSKSTVETIALQIKELKQTGIPIKYIFIDYVNLLRTKTSYLSRRDQITGILSELKQLAQQENIVIVSLAQLNRGVEGRTNKRPNSTDFRETKDLSSIDKLILLYKKDDSSAGTKNEVEGQYSELDFLVFKGHIKSSIEYTGCLNNSNFRITDVAASSKTRLS